MEIVLSNTEPITPTSHVMTGNDLATIFSSLEQLLLENKECDIHCFFGWILKNIFAIDKFLGASFYGYEKSIHSPFTNLEKCVSEKKKCELMIESGAKKEQKWECRELRRLHSSINYDNKRGKNKGSGKETRKNDILPQ